MPSVPQWTADQFWKQVQALASAARAQRDKLNAQKLELQAAYTRARNAGDDPTMKELQPLIHRNSQLRLQWNELRDKFNAAVEGGRSFLAAIGIQEPPTLAFLPVAAIVPALWVAGILAAAVLAKQINDGIREVGDAMKKLGPLGATALSLVPLALVGLAFLYFMPKRRAA